MWLATAHACGSATAHTKETGGSATAQRTRIEPRGQRSNGGPRRREAEGAGEPRQILCIRSAPRARVVQLLLHQLQRLFRGRCSRRVRQRADRAGPRPPWRTRTRAGASTGRIPARPTPACQLGGVRAALHVQLKRPAVARRLPRAAQRQPVVARIHPMHAVRRHRACMRSMHAAVLGAALPRVHARVRVHVSKACVAIGAARALRRVARR